MPESDNKELQVQSQDLSSKPESELTQCERLEKSFMKTQEQWSATIHDLNSKMKDLGTLQSLQNEIYAKHQDLTDYYYTVLNTLGRVSRQKQKKYAEWYNFYKTQSQVRYSSDAAINTQIEAQLYDINEIIGLLSNHVNWAKDTLSNLNSMSYGINNRIEIYKMINGVKI